MHIAYACCGGTRRKLGYPERFAIYDRGDRKTYRARRVAREIRVPNELMRPGDLLYQISKWKTGSVRPPEAAKVAMNDKEHLAAMGYRRYQKRCKQPRDGFRRFAAADRGIV